MRISLKIGLGFAILWFLLKVGLFYFGVAEKATVFMSLFMIFLLLAAISFGLYLEKRQDESGESNLMRDVKNALTAGIPFAMLVSISTYYYDVKIDPETTAHKIAEKSVEIDKMIDSPALLAAFKKENKDAEVMTKEQIRERLQESNAIQASPKNTMIMYLALLILLATLYSLIVAIIMRKLIFR